MRGVGLSIMLGYLPASIAFGALGTALHLPAMLIIGLSLVVYSGALQSTVLGLMMLNTPGALMLTIGFGVNLRHMLYGPHLETARQDWKGWQRWLMSALLTDELYALGLNPTLSPRDWSFLGIGLYGSWLLGTTLGVLAVHLIPSSWLALLSLALPALFIGLLIPRLTHASTLIAALVSGGMAVLGRVVHWPAEFYIVPILLGASAGYWRRPAKDPA